MKLFSRITHSLGVQAMKNLKITYIAPCLIQRTVKKDTLQFLEFLLALHTKTLVRVVGLGDLSFSGVNDTYRMK